MTDAGLDSLLSLLKLKYLDVNRTDVSADSLAEFVRRTPSIVSLGSWEEFSDFEEGIFPTLTEISTNSFSLKTNVKISACVSLTKLHLRMTNSSEKIHTVGSLRSILIMYLFILCSLYGVSHPKSQGLPKGFYQLTKYITDINMIDNIIPLPVE